MKRSLFAVINIFVILLLLTSCVTTKLWKKYAYFEETPQILITKNDNIIAIIGKEYHYFLSSDNVLKSILEWEDKNILNINFYKVNVAKDNTLMASYNISVEVDKISATQRKWLESKGFLLSLPDQAVPLPSPKKKAEAQYLYYKSKIKGQRYLATNNKLIHQQFPIQFSKNPKIQIREDFSNSEKTYRLMFSPITVAVDGTLIVGLVALYALTHPVSIPK